MASTSQQPPRRTRNSPHQKIACIPCRRTRKKCLSNEAEASGPCVRCQERGRAQECQFVPDKRSRTGRQSNTSNASTPSASDDSPQAPTDHPEDATRQMDMPVTVAVTPSASSVLTHFNRGMDELIVLHHQYLSTHLDDDHRRESDLAGAAQVMYRAILSLRAILQSSYMSTAEESINRGFPPDPPNVQAASWPAHEVPIVAEPFEQTPYLPQWQTQPGIFSDGSPPMDTQHIHAVAISHHGYPLQTGELLHQPQLHASSPTWMEEAHGQSIASTPQTSEQNRFVQDCRSQSSISSVSHMSNVSQTEGFNTGFGVAQQPAFSTILQSLHGVEAVAGHPWPTSSTEIEAGTSQNWTEETSDHWV